MSSDSVATSRSLRRATVLVRHVCGSGSAGSCSEIAAAACAAGEGGSLVEVRREGHKVPEELRLKQGSAVRYMENPKAPPPSHAEKARTLVAGQRQGFLATTHHELEVPYGTLINLAMCPETGMPFTVISRIAEHTQNLISSPVCSVLVTQTQGSGDRLATARCTLVGKMERVEKTEGLRREFLKNHPTATYVDFDDFLCWRLSCERLRYIGGFGEMSWVAGSSFYEAAPDTVAAGSQGAVDHMNEDHQDAVLAMTQAFGGLPSASSATLLSLDRCGFEVLAVTAEGRRRTRVPFDSPLAGLEEIRPAVVSLTNRARGALGLPSHDQHGAH